MRGCRLWLGRGNGELEVVHAGMWIMHKREVFFVECI